ncbi:hypothetical protein BDZ90DRAFT_260917 [Jaminaea rosea]|uniref:Uncharacterized protein n=1 Tax=Jaminaea rosea TaxID=1569628 RepID=A0A316UTN1_9BASI|nr:hypothetical protein BDZ90DRAFT_260917 [Jaminaea rosea]PWN27263.1 hypothetical protein BDZ90DRAFT_260917 [Jaminaea rosea]
MLPLRTPLLLLALLAATTGIVDAVLFKNMSILCPLEFTHCVHLPPKQQLVPPVATIEINEPDEFLSTDLSPQDAIAVFPYRSTGTVRFLCSGDPEIEEWRLYFSKVWSGTYVTAGMSNRGRGGVSFDDNTTEKNPGAGQTISSQTRGVNVVFGCREW